MALREKTYFDERSTREMAQHLRTVERSVQQELTVTARMLALDGHEAGLAGQITARASDPGTFWTLRFGLGFDEATPEDFIRVDDDLHTVEGDGMANPATRFHLWVYRHRPDVQAILHTHPPYVSALVATGQPLTVAHMDQTPFFENCAFLAEWPGVPIADQEGEIITNALGQNRSIILAHHGYLTAARSVAEACYLAVYLERAARMHIRASAVGAPKAVAPDLAREARDYLLKPAIVNATFDYFARQVGRAFPELRL